jgi:hypothetical protein
MAAELDLKFTCSGCGLRSGLKIEVEPVAAHAFLYDAGPGSHSRPHPWEDISYPVDDGAWVWDAPDSAAEKAALEEIEVI